MVNKNDIPEGWLNYTPVGKQIPGTIIICFKVPLKEELSRKLPASKRFTPSMLMDKVPNLAGIIDVTNTPRYYDKQVFLKKGILHEKVQCPGHAVPPAGVVIYFQKIMDKMWTTAESAGGKLVGVHCTHGINRTGYLVCRYLIECRGFQPEEAIRLFAENRGHGIERQNYLSDLMALTPGHRCPTSTSHAEFMKKEERRRAFWNTDAPNDSMRPRHSHRENKRHSSRPSPSSSMVHGASTPPPLHHPTAPPSHRPLRAMHHQHYGNSQWHHLRGQQQYPRHNPYHHRKGGFMGQEWGFQHGIAISSHQLRYHPNYPKKAPVGHGSVYGNECHYGNGWHSHSSAGGGHYHGRRSWEMDDSQYTEVLYYRRQQQHHH